MYEQTITVTSGNSYNVSATVPNLDSQGGSASFVILAGGTDVTRSFSVPAPNVSYSEE